MLPNWSRRQCNTRSTGFTESFEEFENRIIDLCHAGNSWSHLVADISNVYLKPRNIFYGNSKYNFNSGISALVQQILHKFKIPLLKTDCTCIIMLQDSTKK